MKKNQTSKTYRKVRKTVRGLVCASGILAVLAYFVCYLFFTDDPEDVDDDFFAAAESIKKPEP